MSIKCMLIDDDPDDQEIFLMCIQGIGNNIHCLTCNSGVEAIAMLESDPDCIPEYIFIDMNMPKMNGITCLGILKDMERLKRAKFFIYSTTSDRSSLDISRKLGANDFIIKPTKMSELREKLAKIFSDLNPD